MLPVRRVKLKCCACSARRWKTWAASDMTKEAITDQVQSGLGEEIKIDAEAKTVSTSTTTLPMSPLFDPSWVKAHRQQTKRPPVLSKDRFRTKIRNNPYGLFAIYLGLGHGARKFLTNCLNVAQALVTPVRMCQNSSTALPRYFLQDWEVVKDPASERHFWAPGPLSFEDVQPHIRPYATDPVEKGAAQPTTTLAQAEQGKAEYSNTNSHDDTITLDADETTSQAQKRRKRAPVTTYCVSRQPMVEALSSRKGSTKLLSRRHGMAIAPKMRVATWRPDMDQLLLKMLRREAVDALITRSTRSRDPTWKFVHPCQNWEDIQHVERRMSILWLPTDSQTLSKQYATYDFEGVAYDRKLAVHNLFWLLGEEEVGRLREASEMFRENEILVLRRWHGHNMMKLHMLIWRLHGYLDNSPT